MIQLYQSYIKNAVYGYYRLQITCNTHEIMILSINGGYYDICRHMVSRFYNFNVFYSDWKNGGLMDKKEIKILLSRAGIGFVVIGVI